MLGQRLLSLCNFDATSIDRQHCQKHICLNKTFSKSKDYKHNIIDHRFETSAGLTCAADEHSCIECLEQNKLHFYLWLRGFLSATRFGALELSLSEVSVPSLRP